MTDPYAPQRDHLADLTEDQTRLPGLIQGIFVIEVGWVLGAALWLGVWSVAVSPEDTTRLAAIVTLLTHGALLAVTLMVVRAVQHRGFWALIGPWEQAMADFFAVMTWAGGLALVGGVVSAIGVSGAPEANLQPILPWLLMLPVAAVAILIQTTAEEVYFRGYIQSTLAARYAQPAIWLVGPSLFFGLLHWQATQGFVETTQTVLITTAFGLAAADLTARTGTLGAAIALHFAYNAMLLLVTGIAGEPVAGLALYLFPPGARGDVEAGPILSLDILIWLLVLAVLWLAARNAVRR